MPDQGVCGYLQWSAALTSDGYAGNKLTNDGHTLLKGEFLMNSPLEIVQQMSKACQAKDLQTIRRLLHPKYTFRNPMIECHSADEMMSMMGECPFSVRAENVRYAIDGNTVVQMADWVHTKPIAFTLRACSFITVEDGRIRSEEMFFDTAKFPKEALDFIEKTRQAPVEKAA
jgi:limonene-1,2-epoxide hydrolase